MVNAGPDGAILKILLAVVILQRRKVVRCLQFYWTEGCFRTTLPKKRSVRPSSRLNTVDLDYRSSLSVAWLVRLWFKSLQSLTAHNRQFYKVTYFFWLCVRTRCLSICAPSFVAVVWCKWALRVIAFWARNTPQTVSRNLKWFLRFYALLYALITDYLDYPRLLCMYASSCCLLQSS